MVTLRDEAKLPLRAIASQHSLFLMLPKKTRLTKGHAKSDRIP
ncbi:hypothetical protein [Moorena sp. SIO3H5]|nr:hypothetical protein [Moorena sp. SIO3H5]